MVANWMPSSPDEWIPVTRQLEALLRSRHPPQARYDVQNLTAILDAARRISMALTLVLLLIDRFVVRVPFRGYLDVASLFAAANVVLALQRARAGVLAHGTLRSAVLGVLLVGVVGGVGGAAAEGRRPEQRLGQHEGRGRAPRPPRDRAAGERPDPAPPEEVSAAWAEPTAKAQWFGGALGNTLAGNRAGA